MKKLCVSLIVVLLVLFLIRCDKSTENLASTSSDNVSVFLSTLPKAGTNARFSSAESMKKCQNDMEQIA